MAQVATYDDVKVNRNQIETRGGVAWNTQFLGPPAGVVGAPHAFLAEGKRSIGPHYHDLDEFQVVVSGGETLGKQRLVLNGVHFARAYTPYGPIIPGEDGLGFVIVRPIRSPNRAYHLPDCREQLMNILNRKPWQVYELPEFDEGGEASVHEFMRIKDEQGLAAFSLNLKANCQTSAPNASTSSGQYILIIKGNLIYQHKDHKAITVIFVKADEHPFQLVAGNQGLEALILHFPRTTAQIENA